MFSADARCGGCGRTDSEFESETLSERCCCGFLICLEIGVGFGVLLHDTHNDFTMLLK